MLIYLLGDVLRIFNGDFKPGEVGGKKLGQNFWLVIAVIMLVPILMIFLSLALDYQVNRVANLVASVFFFLFNIAGVTSYPSKYDRFLIVVSLVFNIITAIYAWRW